MAFDIGMSMDPLALVGSGINAVSQYFTNKSNERNVAATNKANAELAAQQNQWNVDMWNANNEYNTPSAQIERMQKAGMNVNMISGQGQTATGNSSAPASGVNPIAMQAFQGVNPNFQLLEGLQTVLKKKEVEQQIRQVDLNQLKNSADIKNLEALTEKLQAEKVLTESQKQEVDQNCLLIAQNATNAKLQYDILDQQKQSNAIDLAWKSTEKSQAYALGQSKLKLQNTEQKHIVQQILNLITEKEFTEAKIAIAGIDYTMKINENQMLLLDIDAEKWSKEFISEHPQFFMTLNYLKEIASVIGAAFGGAAKLKGAGKPKTNVTVNY